MAEVKHSSYNWITFIALLLTLIGIFSSLRTVFNLTAFNKYPQGGAISINFFGGYPYFPREIDCENIPPQYTPYGQPTDQLIMEKPIPQSTSSALNEKSIPTPTPTLSPEFVKQKEVCLSGVKESRDYTKMSDISQSMLFLFLGFGLLITRKRFFF